MANSQNDFRNGRALPKNVQEKVDTSEDEIDLTEYLRVLWKRKYLIAAGSALPALLFGLFFFFSPSDYKVTYKYDVDQESYTVLPDRFDSAGKHAQEISKADIHLESSGELLTMTVSQGKRAAEAEKDELDEKGHRILIDRFNSTENLDKLIAKLRESRPDEHAREMPKADIRLESSGELLTMTIVGRPKKDMQRISLVVRDNFEKVIPIYSVKKELISAIAKFKAEMADIEENKFSLELELQKKKAILAKLKDLEPADSNKIPGNIILQFDNISENSEYLPLTYQVQITDANIINIEETIKANQEKYDYYKILISLNERLFDEVKNKTSSYYTIREFHSFLTGIVNNYEDKKLVDCLNAYIKKIENVTSTNIPVVEEPGVHLVPKDIVKKITILFVALLLIMTLVAFLLGAVQQRQAPTS
ncbi:MAG: hypothetical protein CEE38_13220 [Planctomycetes bacterium B3_Pla]|nr:MAG: hypothetical protein CEE38_13220 [Planctomycetes bacterium B3_Pla]